MIVAMNHLPNSTDTSEGFLERMIILPFNKKYVDNPINENEGKRDPGLYKKLLEELGGIFYWGLKGLRRLIDNGYIFTEAAQVKELLENFRATNNPIVDFVHEWLRIHKHARVVQSDVYKAFKDFTIQYGYKSFENMSARAFYQALEIELSTRKINFSRQKSNARYYHGFMLLRSSMMSPALTDETIEGFDIY
jgi:putative DNA primase/helicase